MDRTETFAKKFLEKLGHENPIYEPDGNIPPDFLLSDGTAVEVRRLNQLYVNGQGDLDGLETADVALWRTMASLLNEYRSPLATPSTFGVFYTFSRPIPARRVIARELKVELDRFLGDRDMSVRSTLPCGIGLRFFDWGSWKGTPFRMAGNMDAQRGGWVVQRLELSIRHALAEKEAKVQAFKNKYSRWWLLLVDHVSWGTDENDRRQLRGTGPFVHSFDKVFVVNAEHIEEYFEL